MCDFHDNSLPTISQHEKKKHVKQMNTTENPCNMPGLKIIETNMIPSKSKKPKITQGNQSHEPTETHIQDKLYVMNKDMPRGERFFEDNNMFSITNTLQPMKTISILIIIQEKTLKITNYMEAILKKDHNSNGNVHGLNTIFKQMTNKGPDSKKEINY